MIEKCRPWWKKSKNDFSATPSGRLLMLYTLKERKLHCDSGDICIMTFWGQMRSNVGQNRQIRVKSGRLVEIYPIYICFDSEFCPEFKFKILWGPIRRNRGQTRVKLVKLGSNRPSSRNIDLDLTLKNFEFVFWTKFGVKPYVYWVHFD